MSFTITHTYQPDPDAMLRAQVVFVRALLIVQRNERLNAQSWKKKRLYIWDRDGGICQVCRESIPFEYYECGHMIDRHVGGSDDVTNLVVMCIVCNRLKPSTPTIGEYYEWAAAGGPVRDFVWCDVEV